MTPELLATLRTDLGAALFHEIGPYAADSALAASTRLRARGYDPDLVSAALAQARLRSLAQEKFGAAESMWFTADGLEQATRPPIAALHAERFHQAQVRTVVDLGCGIGADAMAFAHAGLDVLAVEADPVTAAIAAANLAAYESSRVVTGRAEQIEVPAGAGVWVDPARRLQVRAVDGRAKRVWSLQQISPSWEQVLAWAAEHPATGAKLSPLFAHAAIPAGAEAQWTSWRGEVLECAVWWGPLARSVGRTASVCRPGRPAVVVTEADAAGAGAPLRSIDELGPWLWEADRAVLRAGLSGALPGRELAAGLGYSTATREVDCAFARRWRVIDAMPLREKTIRAWLRERDIGQVTVKKRGVSIDADALGRAVSSRRPGRAVVVLTLVGGQAGALVVAHAPGR